MTHLLWFFALVYVAEGAGGLISQPLNYYLKQVHGWTPPQISAYVTILNLPWMIKPLYWLVSDLFPLFGYRRKSYLLLANAAAIAWPNSCGTARSAMNSRRLTRSPDATEERQWDGEP